MIRNVRHGLILAVIFLSACQLESKNEPPSQPDTPEPPKTQPETKKTPMVCGRDQSVQGDACVCGQSRMAPNDARFWNCVGERFLCFRDGGCYVGGTRFDMGAEYRGGMVLCGDQVYPGGEYVCEWLPPLGKMMWQCRGACVCGPWRVQYLNGQVVSGDLIYGRGDFVCDSTERRAPGIAAVNGGERCGESMMNRGQVCRGDQIYCGDQIIANNEAFESYICEDGRMVCRAQTCDCGGLPLHFGGVCVGETRFCGDDIYPENGAFLCTPRGLVCGAAEGCFVGGVVVPYGAVYSAAQTGEPIITCGDQRLPAKAQHLACVQDMWACTHPKGCRTSAGVCFAGIDDARCRSIDGIKDLSAYDIHYTYDVIDDSAQEHWSFECKAGARCTCGKTQCGAKMMCTHGSCRCGGEVVDKPSNGICTRYASSSYLYRQTQWCDGKACDGECVEGVCHPIRGKIGFHGDGWVCLDADGCERDGVWFMPGSESNADYASAASYERRYRAHQIVSDADRFAQHRHYQFAKYAYLYGWDDCLRAVSQNGVEDVIDDHWEEIIASHDRYACEPEKSEDSEEETAYTLKFRCAQEVCRCGGSLCMAGEFCSEGQCFAAGVSFDDEPTAQAECGGIVISSAEVCEWGQRFCADEKSGTRAAYPGDREAQSAHPFLCARSSDGRRGWICRAPSCLMHDGGSVPYGTEIYADTMRYRGVAAPDLGYRLHFEGADGGWLCADASAGCRCGEERCAVGEVCADGACMCGKAKRPQGAGWACVDAHWQCTLESGCADGDAVCPKNGVRRGADCLCGGAVVTTSEARCDGGAVKGWQCLAADGCRCEGVRIAQGEMCYSGRFLSENAQAFAQNRKPYSCGETVCPAYTRCYEGQCLFRGSGQAVETGSGYVSHYGFPRCMSKEGCRCGDQICERKAYCRDGKCLKYPTYGVCDGKTVAVNRVAAEQEVRKVVGADGEMHAWRSLFKIRNYPVQRLYRRGGGAADDGKLPWNAELRRQFFASFANPEGFSSYCERMPDKRHIDDYELWVGEAHEVIWDMEADMCDYSPAEASGRTEAAREKYCESRWDLEYQVDTFYGESSNPFVYDHDASKVRLIDALTQMRDEQPPYALGGQASEKGGDATNGGKERRYNAVIGWVCASESGCSCQAQRCARGQMCVKDLSQDGTVCLEPVHVTSLTPQRYVMRQPSLTDQWPESYGSAAPDESHDMVLEGYHSYEICTSQEGCDCGSSRCLQDGVCVDHRQCLYDCPRLSSSETCMIPYVARACPGAETADEKGQCIYGGKSWAPRQYRFDAILGAQCLAQSCACEQTLCRYGAWCYRGECVSSK